MVEMHRASVLCVNFIIFSRQIPAEIKMREFNEIHILVMSPKQKIFEPFQKPFFRQMSKEI